MASIHKRGSAFVVRWREQDRHRSRRCPTHAIAREVAREVEGAVALGREWVPAADLRTTSILVVADGFVRSLALRRAPRTVAQVAAGLDIWLEWLDDRHRGRQAPDVSILSMVMLETYVQHLQGKRSARHGRPLETSTIHVYVGAVERLWAWAAERDEFVGVPKPRRILSDLGKPAGRTVVAPTWEQMDRCVWSLGDAHRKLGVVLYYTGLRVKQAMHLRWDDLDLVAGMLAVRGELGKTPAERRGRVVPISRHLVDELVTWPRSDAWVVPGRGAATPELARLAVAPPFERAWRLAGVPEVVWRRRTHHAFRAGVETGLLAAGASWEAVETLLGHALPGAGDRYTDRTRLPLREAVALIPPLTRPEGRGTQGEHGGDVLRFTARK